MDSRTATAFLCPRGEGPHKKAAPPKDEIQLRRSFYLTGSTLESWQVLDIRTAIKQLRALPEVRNASLTIEASGTQAVNVLYASLFEPPVARLDLRDVPVSHLHASAPAYLNVLKYLDVPQAAAMAAEHSLVRIRTTEPGAWDLARDLSPEEDPHRGLKVLSGPDETSPRE